MSARAACRNQANLPAGWCVAGRGLWPLGFVTPAEGV